MKFRRGCPSIALPASVQSKRASSAFTLVELLVVIGIIALLISVLLPALSSARRQAATVKCEAALRDIGNAVVMYVSDNKGWAPPAKLLGGTYSIDANTFTSGNTCYWFNFLAKYETKQSVGWAGSTAGQQANAQKTIFWGCPAWNGYIASGAAGLTAGINEAGGIEVTQVGYGFNGFPEYTAGWPKKSDTLGESTLTTGPDDGSITLSNAVATPAFSGTTGWAPPATGKWYKFTSYTHASDRALLGDCLFWFMEARSGFPTGIMARQYTMTNNNTWAQELDGNYETTFDFYRHGIYPKAIGDVFNLTGGKVAFNVLFCDGHVQTVVDPKLGYLYARMRAYPN